MYTKKTLEHDECRNIYIEISQCYYEKNNNPKINCLPAIKKLLNCVKYYDNNKHLK